MIQFKIMVTMIILMTIMMTMRMVMMAMVELNSGENEESEWWKRELLESVVSALWTPEREGEIKSVVHQQSTDKTKSITTDNSSTKNRLKTLGIYTNQKSGGHPGPDFLVMALGASLTSSFAL